MGKNGQTEQKQKRKENDATDSLVPCYPEVSQCGLRYYFPDVRSTRGTEVLMTWVFSGVRSTSEGLWMISFLTFSLNLKPRTIHSTVLCMGHGGHSGLTVLFWFFFRLKITQFTVRILWRQKEERK